MLMLYRMMARSSQAGDCYFGTSDPCSFLPEVSWSDSTIGRSQACGKLFLSLLLKVCSKILAFQWKLVIRLDLPQLRIPLKTATHSGSKPPAIAIQKRH